MYTYIGLEVDKYLQLHSVGHSTRTRLNNLHDNYCTSKMSFKKIAF